MRALISLFKSFDYKTVGVSFSEYIIDLKFFLFYKFLYTG